jgi:hypothetical protein
MQGRWIRKATLANQSTLFTDPTTTTSPGLSTRYVSPAAISGCLTVKMAKHVNGWVNVSSGKIQAPRIHNCRFMSSPILPSCYQLQGHQDNWLDAHSVHFWPRLYVKQLLNCMRKMSEAQASSRMVEFYSVDKPRARIHLAEFPGRLSKDSYRLTRAALSASVATIGLLFGCLCILALLCCLEDSVN